MTREAEARQAVEPSLFDQVPEVPLTPRSHQDDPSTSARAAEKATITARSRAYRVLCAYEHGQQLSADEAAAAMGEPAYEVRKRCSDLQRIHLLTDAGSEGLSAHGNEARRLKITEDGHRAIWRARGARV